MQRRSGRTAAGAKRDNPTFVEYAPPPTPRIRYTEEEDDDTVVSHLPPPRRQLGEEGQSDEEVESSSEEEGDETMPPGQVAIISASDPPRSKSSSPVLREEGNAADGPQGLTSFNPKTGVTLTMEEMISNCVYLFLLNENKKLPIKRSDIIKYGMNGQKKCFDEVMKKFEKVLDETLGLTVVGIEKRPKGPGFLTYMLLSKYKADVAEANITVRAKGAQAKRGLLFLILCITFMQNKSVDEDMVWKIITSMEFEELGCPSRKEDLQKFLKQEYVIPQYLSIEEFKDGESIILRYNWGPRSHNEISKWSILKYVASNFPNVRPQDYDFQFSLIKDMEKEKDAIEADLALEGVPPTNPEDGKNGSALNTDDANDADVIFENILRKQKRKQLQIKQGGNEEEEEEIQSDLEEGSNNDEEEDENGKKANNDEEEDESDEDSD